MAGRERALVLGGGGSAGNAWEIGVIAGLFDAGLDVTKADLIIGTSAGSTAAAQITSATQPPELLADILAAAPPPPSSASAPRPPDLRAAILAPAPHQRLGPGGAARPSPGLGRSRTERCA